MKVNSLYVEKYNTETREVEVHKNNGEIVKESFEVLNEHLVKVYINEKESMRVVCTGTNLVELVVGRIISEGIINNVDDIESIFICEYGLRARVFLKNDISKNMYSKDTDEILSCCQDNRSYLKGEYKLEKIQNVMDIEDKSIFDLAKIFSDDSKIHKLTSGTHAAYLYYDNKFIKSFEDIGRHNALDKIVGYIYMNNYVPEKCYVFTTGRVPIDMARKAIFAKIGCLVSKSVPTSDAIDLAKEYDLNLICRCWPDSFVVGNRAKI